jgi:hypothetical protein
MKKTRSVVFVSVMMSLGLALISCQTAPMSKSDKEEQQDSVRNMANTTLSQLSALCSRSRLRRRSTNS